MRQPIKHENAYRLEYKPVETILFGKKHPVVVRRELRRIWTLKKKPTVYATNYSAMKITAFGELTDYHQYDYAFAFVAENRHAPQREQVYFVGLTQFPNADRKDYENRQYSVHLLHADMEDIVWANDYPMVRHTKLVHSLVPVGDKRGKWEYIPLAFPPKYIEYREGDRAWRPMHPPEPDQIILYGEDSSMMIPLVHRGRAIAWSACDHSPITMKVGNCLHKTVCRKCGIEVTVDTSG